MPRKQRSRPEAVNIDNAIQIVRGERIILDSSLARIYGIPTHRLNEAVRRNQDRFPEDFIFQLNKGEYESLISQIAISKTGRGGRRRLPFAFTEYGVIMAANILRSDRALQMSIFVVRAFIKIRQALATNWILTEKLNELERRLTKRIDVHEEAINYVLRELKKLLEPAPLEPKRRSIGFGGTTD